MKFPKSYELVDEVYLEDIMLNGYLLSHKKTKARIVVIPNDDDNKVFYIGFRTPPSDSTGVAHIMEHSVLCGSDKYPVKDPFVELAKGSLNTFLNAMTYPDKTIYPVASCNDKDFSNLMDVYLDAVFHPHIFKHKEIFEQEGWHYELESTDSDLQINGVVYNEMKGAYSSPDAILEREIFSRLFPDNAYFYESGGNPKVIPDLTYDEFLDFYKKYYHPSNSYIYLYGDLDIEDKLNYIDENYLSKYDEAEINSTINKQKPFEEHIRIEKQYPISQGEDEDDGTYLTYNYVLDVSDNPIESVAMEVLDYALINSTGAPIRKALMDAKIGKTVIGGFEDGMIESMFSLGVKCANPEDEDRFLEIIRSEINNQITNGIDKKSIKAAMKSIEFKIRESDYGSNSKGLIVGIKLLDSWLYNDNKPFEHFNTLAVIEELKKKIDTDYFEKLTEKYLVNNTHAAIVIAKPKRGLASKEDEILREKLSKIKSEMTEDELKEVISNTKHLKEYQETPSPEEDLEKIPLLTREDLKKEERPIDLEEKDIGGIKVLHHNVSTNNINYLKLLFNINHIAFEDLGYVSLLAKMLGLVDTEEFSYADYCNEIHLNTGGIGSSIRISSLDGVNCDMYFEVETKFLCEDIMSATHLVEQMILHSDFSDASRLKELVKMERTRVESRLSDSGHIVATLRATSHFSRPSLLKDITSGLEYYKFIKDLEENFDKRCHFLQKKCIELCHSVFRKSNLLVSTTGDDKVYDQLKTYLPRLGRHLFTDNYRKSNIELVCIKKNEAFKDASLIQYVARAGSFKARNFEYTGYLQILKTILSYDYLWIKVRVMGGAYGAMSTFERQGTVALVSYRDPNLAETNDVFEKTGDYIRDFDANEHEMTKFVIGTVSGMDTPLTPKQRGERALYYYLNGVTFDMLQKERDEIINATAKDIRNLADLMDAVMEQNHLCVIGNEENIEANKELFDDIKQLI